MQAGISRHVRTFEEIVEGRGRVANQKRDDVGKVLRAYLRLLAVLTAVSCLGLLFLPTELGAMTPWGAAPGWQREIAFWNLSMCLVIVWTLRRADVVSAHLLVTALVVLNGLVAANHFATVMQGSGALLNTIAGAINFGSGILGLVALRWEQITDSDAVSKQGQPPKISN